MCILWWFVIKLTHCTCLSLSLFYSHCISLCLFTCVLVNSLCALSLPLSLCALSLSVLAPSLSLSLSVLCALSLSLCNYAVDIFSRFTCAAGRWTERSWGAGRGVHEPRLGHGVWRWLGPWRCPGCLPKSGVSKVGSYYPMWAKTIETVIFLNSVWP